MSAFSEVCSASAGSERRHSQIIVDGVVYTANDDQVICFALGLLTAFSPRSLICLCGFVADVDNVGLLSTLGEDLVFVSACIPSSIATIPHYSFYRCRALSSLTFEPGSNVSRIDVSAFIRCSSLLSVCIPASVETLGQNCFAECTKLSIVTFEAGSKLLHIEEAAFSILGGMALPGLLL
jgi:hypothetical protein